VREATRSAIARCAPVTAVVPVKPLTRAKSRLLLDDDERADLALAFALDTVDAVRRSPLVRDVVVVTSDDVVSARIQIEGVRVVHDGGQDLRDAVRIGASEASHGVIVVPGDLPCLSAEDVTALIAASAGTGGAFVPDRQGTGTTLIVLPPGATETRYGPGSACAHRDLGLVELYDAPPTARQDVDTLADLDAAARLGVGPETRAVMALRDLEPELSAS
jgi:2-phospho-L-lactate guanylyltransferase